MTDTRKELTLILKSAAMSRHIFVTSPLRSRRKYEAPQAAWPLVVHRRFIISIQKERRLRESLPQGERCELAAFPVLK